jgi:hypothetical protein
MLKRTIPGLLLLIVFAATASQAGACVCASSFVQYQPCTAYWSSEIVFVGTATEVGNVIIGAELSQATLPPDRRFTRLKVDEPFRGTSDETVEIFDHNTSCDYHFEKGKRYFVYAYRDPKDQKIYVSSCSPTRPADSAGPDLAFARGVIRNEPTPAIVGLVTRETRAQVQDYRRNEYLEGVRVVAIGPAKKTAEAFTDADGIFRFFGLPAGSYSVQALTPPSLRRLYDDEVLEVQVKDGRCSGGQFTVTSLSSIGGTVVDSAGAPMQTSLNLVPIDAAGNDLAPAEGTIEAWSNKQGKYVFDWLAPGRYLVAINSKEQPGSYDPPFPRSYLPGVLDRQQAAIFQITEGQQIAAPEFRLPPPLTPRTIEGVARWPDGSPAPNALVWIEFTARNWTETYSANAEGRFSLKLFDGFKYLIAAEVRRPVNGAYQATHSRSVEISVGPANPELLLVVTEPGFVTRSSGQAPRRKQ